MNWWDLIVDRVTGDIRDLVSSGAPGLTDHGLVGDLGYVRNLERALST